MRCGSNFSNKTSSKISTVAQAPTHDNTNFFIKNTGPWIHIDFINKQLYKTQTEMLRICPVYLKAYKNSTKSLSHDCNKHVGVWYLILWWMRVQDNDDLCITASVHHLDSKAIFRTNCERYSSGSFPNVEVTILMCTADTLIVTCNVCSVWKNSWRWGKCPETCRYAVKRARNPSSTSPRLRRQTWWNL